MSDGDEAISDTSERARWGPLLRLVRRQWRGLALGALVGLLWTSGKVAVPQLTRLAIDRSIEGAESAWGWAFLIACAGLVSGTFTATRRYVAFRESRLTETRLRERLLNHILGLHIGYHDRAQTGQLMSRASSDIQQVQMFVVMLPLTLSNLALISVVTVVLFSTDATLALFALAPLPLVNLTARRFSNQVHPAVRRVQQEQAQLATVVEETVAGVRVIKGFGAEQVQADKLEVEADDIRDASMVAAKVRARFLPFMELMPAAGLIAVLGIGGHRVLDGQLSVGELVAFNFYVALLVWPLRTIGMTVAFGQRAATALQRIDEVLDVVPEVVDPEHPRVGAHSGSVRFQNVRFGYGEDVVLDGLTLDIEPGTSVALVGATGSGKSTMARLLVRFYDPVGGSIELGGVDLRDQTVHDVRRSVGLVFEDTLLFHDTVAANIAFANPDADEATIRAAAALAGAADFIDELPEGYDTVLGERGFSLSGGQRQRVAIARAVVSDPSVLILDDATSAVDPTKEHEIRDAMGTVMQGRTTIVIAHRPGTIAMADRVVLIDRGKVAAQGTHDELLATSTRYRDVLAAARREHVEADPSLSAGGGD
ncbi:MAG: ABC transporter ATP-binding protein [Ilumatobacter sp.]|uniref:ABC transporter ATP-binding protein n=1 Tax=Ilumatobacter sp. TaxID=1967498 RepID=UPI00261EEC79|nr:ABC transporter ATP-binding protein [Ilumatobacter sp.]MDJ0768493.1 ABC transporter ATP-binding protein [Ilumatobacter sp.]